MLLREDSFTITSWMLDVFADTNSCLDGVFERTLHTAVTGC